MLQWATDFSSVVAAASETDSQPWTFVNDLGLPSRLVWATTVTDPNAPVNPTKVGRLEINPTNDNYPTYGVSIQDLHSIRKFIPLPTASKLYWSYWFKYLPGFTTEAYQFKQTEMFYGNNQGLHIIATNGSTTEPWQLEFVNAGASSLERVGGAMTVFTNTWYQVEVIITYATRHEQMFVNGRPYIDYIGNATNWPSGAPAEFGYVWVYGGIGGSQLTTSIYAYWDTIYMSYVP